MLRYAEKPFQSATDLMKMYRMAYERAKYLPDIDDKLLAYNEVINYCASSKECVVEESIKRNQILFWTYNNIGDMFLEKSAEDVSSENYLYAVQYYQSALEFAKTAKDKRLALGKTANVYRALQDEKGWRATVEQIALEEDDELKRQAFVDLANGTDNIQLQAKYLEHALNFVTQENASVAVKCKHTLDICARLLDIYQKTKKEKDYNRILELQQNTLELLH